MDLHPLMLLPGWHLSPHLHRDTLRLPCDTTQIQLPCVTLQTSSTVRPEPRGRDAIGTDMGMIRVLTWRAL